MDYESFLQNIEQIKEHISVIASDPWQKWGVIASFAVAIVAIYASFKDEVKGWLFPPNVELQGRPFDYEQNNLFITRIQIVNKGWVIAKNVSFIVEKLEYREGNNLVQASNFLPFPLTWANYNVESKDLHLKKPYFLDICEVYKYNKEDTNLYISICPPSSLGRPASHNLDDIKKGSNKLKLTMYCENLKSKSYTVTIDWDGNFNPASVYIEK